jgi:hypothetical protein
MSNTSESFVRSMRALCADEVRLRELRLGLLAPVEELVFAILATLDDLPEHWPLRTSRPAS